MKNYSAEAPPAGAALLRLLMVCAVLVGCSDESAPVGADASADEAGSAASTEERNLGATEGGAAGAGSEAPAVTAAAGVAPASPVPSGEGVARPLNDTGVVFAGNHPRTVNDECKGVIDPEDDWVMGEQFARLEFGGQDCAFGRDATAAAPEDGHAGFSFTKLAADGSSLAADAAEWACVRDNVTGLLWEAKPMANGTPADQGLHDADDRYSFYSTNSLANGGEIGNWNKDWADCHGYVAKQPPTFCNTQSFAERVNASRLCGRDNWRLPQYGELLGIVNYGRTQPAAEMTFFPDTQAESYWTSAISGANAGLARYINFLFGISAVGYRTDALHVRLVSSEAPAGEARQ